MGRTYDQEEAGPDGWSRWIYPLPGYVVACCDCGLVHEMELRQDGGVLEYRVKLAPRATAAIRRERKRRGEHVP